MLTELYKYQKEGVRKIWDLGGRALLADEPGLGKTIQSLRFAFENSTARPVIAIVPASLKLNWQEEAKMHVGIDALILSSRTPKLLRKHHKAEMLIINYEVIGWWIEALQELDPQIVIVDECHLIKSLTAKRTKHVIEFCASIPHVICMSGTPMVNRPAELWPVLHILQPELFDAFWPYAVRYCKPKKSSGKWQFKGATNLEELHSLLTDTVMIRRKKMDVLTELPNKRRIIVPMPMTHPEEYTYAEENFMEWVATQPRVNLFKVARNETLVKLGYLRRLAAKLKLKYVMEWTDNFLEGSDEKFILFHYHNKIMNRLQKHYPNNSVTIRGGMSIEEKRECQRLFNNDPTVRLLLGKTQVAGVGLNFQKECSNVGFVEMQWTPGEHRQAEDRVHRIGQTNKVTCYYFIAKGTIEEDIAKLIQAKGRILDQALDGGKMKDDIDIFDRLVKAIERRSNREKD